MQIAITGANGYIGKQLMRLLPDAVGLVRHTSTDLPVNRQISVDYASDAELQSALKGCQTLVHLAGKAHGQGSNAWEDFRTTNVDLSLRLADAALAAGVSRLVFVSSIKALGESTRAGEPFTQASTPAPLDDYGRSKLLAEQRLQQRLSGTALELIIVRPPLVWGDSPKGNLAAILTWARTGIPLPLGGINNRRHWVSLPLLCGFLAHLAQRSTPFNLASPLLVSDTRALSTTDALSQLLISQGIRPRLFALPGFVWRLLARLPGLAGPILKMTGNLEVDASDSWRLTDWRPGEASQVETRLP